MIDMHTEFPRSGTPETMAMELLLSGKISWKHQSWTDWIKRASLDEKDDPEYCTVDKKRHGNLPVRFSFTNEEEKEEDESRLTLMTKFSSCFDTFYLEKRDFPVTNCDENFDGTLDWILIEGEDAFSNVFPSSSTCNTRFRSDMRNLPCPGYPSDHIPVVADIKER